ncbi:hypothetical protein LSH36_46g04008 [Paralvinella palmiformis]|uniref:Uncharacterized protein n=1 Tax=Paralvinella palmiformis TaxID=53620 RepID=A0AAD9K6I5_9ANNE|nr:hypothetical protein LSH36_46g04008 [Paralvinella palmiformis]
MSDPDGAKAKCKPNMECLGGNAFLLLATGLFCLLPGSVLMAYYGDLTGFTAIRLGTFILFISGACFVIFGVLLIIYWCQASGYKSLPERSEDAESGKKPVDQAKVKEEHSKSKDKEKPARFDNKFDVYNFSKGTSNLSVILTSSGEDSGYPATSGEMLTGRTDPGRMELTEQWHAQKKPTFVDYGAPSSTSSADDSYSSYGDGYQYENPVLRHELGDDGDGK